MEDRFAGDGGGGGRYRRVVGDNGGVEAREVCIEDASVFKGSQGAEASVAPEEGLEGADVADAGLGGVNEGCVLGEGRGELTHR